MSSKKPKRFLNHSASPASLSATPSFIWQKKAAISHQQQTIMSTMNQPLALITPQKPITLIPQNNQWKRRNKISSL